MGALEGVAGFPNGNGMREGWKGSDGLVAPPADDIDLMARLLTLFFNGVFLPCRRPSPCAPRMAT